MKLLAQGAESKIFLDKDRIIKERFPKTYRIKEIDNRLRKSRTNREAKVLEKLRQINFPVPNLISHNGKDTITMDFIEGKLLKNILGKNNKNNHIKLSRKIGEKIAILHNNNIIHGDLTTSNMILDKEIYFIDFGLSFIGQKAEHKAVDLHLLKQALESKHYKHFESSFKTPVCSSGF